MKHIDWQTKTFSELSTDELYDIVKLRIDVFVVEQTCYYHELDNLDKHPKTQHIFYYLDNQLAAYARVLAEQTSYREYISIGRVVVSDKARGCGLAHKILTKAIAVCHQFHPGKSIKISAQEHLEQFYQQHGFTRVTGMYLEDNIPHIAMINEMNGVLLNINSKNER